MSERLSIKFKAWELLFELYELLPNIPEITINGDGEFECRKRPRDMG